MLVQKVFEPLNAMLEAYEARLKPDQTLEERWKAYLDPVIESRRLDLCQKLVEITQALLKQQAAESVKRTKAKTTPPLQKGRSLGSKRGTIETKDIANPWRVKKRTWQLGHVLDSEEAETMGVPKVRDNWPNKLWEAIQKCKRW